MTCCYLRADMALMPWHSRPENEFILWPLHQRRTSRLSRETYGVRPRPASCTWDDRIVAVLPGRGARSRASRSRHNVPDGRHDEAIYGVGYDAHGGHDDDVAD